MHKKNKDTALELAQTIIRSSLALEGREGLLVIGCSWFRCSPVCCPGEPSEGDKQGELGERERMKTRHRMLRKTRTMTRGARSLQFGVFQGDLGVCAEHINVAVAVGKRIL